MDLFSPLNPPHGADIWPFPDGLPLALAVATAGRRQGGPLVVVAPDNYSARRLRDDVNRLEGRELAVLFPDWETLPYDLYSPHPDIISRRLELLSRLKHDPPAILLAAVSTLLQRLPPPGWVGSGNLRCGTGDQLEPEGFKQQLADAGYQSSDQVWQPGQFAVRGAVIDLWPMASRTPFRIELFDDEIESIRTFDPESQRTLEKIQRIDLFPAREYPFNEEARQSFRRRFRTRFDVDLRRALPYREVGEGHHPQGLEYYLPLFFDETATLFDYLSTEHRWLLLDGIEPAADTFRTQLAARFEQRQGDFERPVLDPDELYLPPGEARERIGENITRQLSIESPPPLAGEGQGGGIHDARAPSPRPSPSSRGRGGVPAQNVGNKYALPPLDLEHNSETLIRFVDEFPGRVLVAADSPGRRELIHDTLRGLKLEHRTLDSWAAFVSGEDKLVLSVLPLSGGALLADDGLAVITEQELFPEHARTARQSRDERARRDPEALIRSLADLAPGAPVVHEDHGIGRYQGLNVLDVGGQQAEFLTMEYAGGDKLYVPVADLHLVTRFTGADPEAITLHRLGSDQWKKARKRAASKIRDAAAELLNIQARRASRTGHAYDMDRSMYARFAAGFPYEETDDQLQAIEQVLADLASDQPMDRVVCGDVGFGKTEVALRAAFAVATSGRQVALLAPTTLLAEQHFRTFSDRFADWPVNIELLSRLGTGKQTQATLDGLRDGTVDIVIGTHKLLQRDVKFKQLGLVIVDEEQRFGVRQKERMKAMRAEVDLLTLTATPIPRTLNMSLGGLRGLSIIATAPARRMAVRTFVSEWDATMIRDAVTREFQRGGQIYYLHNEVRSIDRVARELGEKFPSARIAVAHGQMNPSELEQIMRGFYARRVNMLVCTTIIENGIDVPSANTIIINRADKFGLAQMHQLRGRVGRSHHLAYAYLLTPPWKTLTSDARKRLEAIQSLEELGAGFTLATHDLEIRGAGELLGEGQSGQIEAIGFALYSELLGRAVEALQSGIEPDLEAPMSVASDVDLHAAALIPEDYLPDVHQRLTLYKRIAQAGTAAELHELKVEMIDRFGLLPEAVKNLVACAELRLEARRLGISRLEIGPAGGRIEFHPDPAVDMAELIRMVQKESHAYQFDGGQKLRLLEELEEPEERFDLARELIERLQPRNETFGGSAFRG